jgi:hypothetical protein
MDAIGTIPGIGNLGAWFGNLMNSVSNAFGWTPNTPLIGWIGWIFNAVPALLVLLALFIVVYNVLARTFWRQWDIQVRADRLRAIADKAKRPIHRLWLLGAFMVSFVTFGIGWLRFGRNLPLHALLIIVILLVSVPAFMFILVPILRQLNTGVKRIKAFIAGRRSEDAAPKVPAFVAETQRDPLDTSP